MRAARSNLSWQELGTKLRFQRLWPTLQKVVKAARKRRLKWEAFRLFEADKYGNRKPIGQWLWIPKTGVIVEAVRGHFIGAGGRPVGRPVNGEREAIHRDRAHPLARTAKEAFDAMKWGDWRRGKRRRWGATRMTPGPQYADWLEAREWAEREGRRIPSFDRWRSGISERWHREWLRSGPRRGEFGPPPKGVRYAEPYYNPKRRARRPRRNPRRRKKHLSRWDPKSWPRKGRGGESPIPIDSRYWIYVYNPHTGKGERVAWSTNQRVAMSALRKLQREHGKMGAWIFDRASKRKITTPW